VLLIRRVLTFTAATAFVGGAVLLSACGGGSGDDKTATPAGSATAGATVARTATSGTATSSLDIRSIDISQSPDVAALVKDTGGQFSKDRVMYADVTADGADEAIVPIGSGGTMGDVAFLVLTAAGDGTKTLLKEYPTDQTGLSISVQDGKVLMTQPVPGPDDPFCCPSFLKTTTYSWNGYTMAIESVNTNPNPDAGGKGTPSADTPPESTPAPATTAQPPAFAPEGTAASGDRPKPPAPGAVP
jgi:hypothetical protein